MPPYQLLLAEALVGAAAISGLALFFAHSQQRKIRLPTTQDTGLVDDVNQDDPFNVTKPEDFIDGEPIDEDAFWFKVSIIMVIGRVSRRVLSWFRCATGNYSLYCFQPPLLCSRAFPWVGRPTQMLGICLQNTYFGPRLDSTLAF